MEQVKRFSFKELQAATDNFSNKNILGKGGFGNVYKGRLADGSWVAVKRIKEQRMQGGEYYFQKEVQMISMAVHRNLLRLSGFCMTPKERLLVYPYMANGSVASRLNKDRPPNQPPLDWPIRKQIALGSARGLSYLHHDCDPKIIHHDVKASNVFLDEKFEAVIGDFSSMGYSNTYVMTAGCGTFGHIAPEYFSTGNVSEKTDVFGFGIMLLELITGQRAFDLSRLADDGDVMLLDWVKKLLITGQRVFDLPRLANDGDVMLLDWVKGLLKDKKLVLDPDLKTNYVSAEVEQLIKVALQCTQGSPMNRPKMSDVVRTLEGNRLPEKWDKWQKREVIQIYLSPLPNSVCILDSTHNLQAVELSGPR